MKVIAGLLLLLDAYIGIRFLLNMIGVLQTSKYSKNATAFYAILFTVLAIAGIYFLFIKPNKQWALWISIAPWALMLLILFITMITSDYK
jgi:hypothetical protein